MAFSDVNTVLREWAPLTDLFNKLPAKVQNGLFAQEVKLSCIDILPEFIALGTNLGIVYWYDRKKKDLERLRCEKNNTPITAVKVISTVDYMLACGNKEGNVSIFQIPKSHPDSIPESLKPKNKQVERYTVSDLHKSPVTALEWSKNGMKLFSGDKTGSIVLTEIDFNMHICRSMEILNETYQVVQLSYNQQKLLVSTTYRSIVCYRADKWKVSQVGKKDRKILGNFGGIIHRNSPTSDIVLYCTRPGLRLWVADCEGNVQNTLLFKDLLCKQCVEVPIINPISRSMKALKPLKESSFGVLLPFNDLIITYNNDVIYILDPQTITVLYTMSLFRSVLSVAAHKDEIFVLEEERSIIRIGFKPEPVSESISYSPTTNIDSIASKISDLSQKIQSTNIVSAMSPFTETPTNDFNIHTDSSLIMNAEEAKESPVRIPSMHPEIERKFNEIGKQEFSDKILYKQKRKKHNPSISSSMYSLSSNSSEEKEISFTKPMLMNLSTVGVLPDLRSPESIQSDIEYKEKILADVLNLDRIKINLDNLQKSNEDKTSSKINLEPSSSTSLPQKIKEPSIKQPIMIHRAESTVGTNPHRSSQAEPNPTRKPQLVPAFRSIPNEWKLANIQLNTQLEPDHSLADWELL